MRKTTLLMTMMVALSCQPTEGRAEIRPQGPISAEVYDVDLGVCVSAPEICEAPFPELVLGEPTVLSLTPLEAAILGQARQCRRGSDEERLPDEVLLELLRIEEELVPPYMRGVILAAGCSESGLQAEAEGDHQFSKAGRPKAIGIVQMWPWWVDKYGIDRRDPLQAGRAYLTEMASQTRKAELRCGVTGEDAWVIGQARVARGAVAKGYKRQLRKLPLSAQERIRAKYGIDLSKMTKAEAVRIGKRELPLRAIQAAERCFDRTGHIKRLHRWRRAWEYEPEYIAMSED